MGDGKTEAALAGAYRRWTEGGERGLYFALPTQLTSNRIRDRVEEFIKRIVAEESSLALVHGNAWLSDKRIRPLDPQPLGNDSNEADNATEANRWFSDSRRSMLAPFGVGTIDQALMAVVPVKYSALRMFGLGGKVVVIDEVHSYDPFTSALADRLVKWLIEIGGTVVVLSATLTASRRASLVEATGAQEQNAPTDYPLVTKVATGSSNAVHFSIDGPRPTERRVSIQILNANDECWMTEVTHAASNGACVLVIRNTVDLARQTCLALKSQCTDTGIEFGLIHSRFTQGDRDKNETLWTNLLGRDGAARPRHGAILVGTQVLEQSLDIDADLLVTDLAPTDLILQRIGRLHRHTRHRPPVIESPRCIVLRPDVNWNASLAEVEAALSPHRFIYPPFALFMADIVWGDLESITLPSGIRPVLEKSAIEPASLPPSIREFIDAMNHQTNRMRQAAWLKGIFKAPAVGDAEGAETRWNMQPTAWIVVLSRQPTRSGHRIEVAFPDSTSRQFDDSAFDFPLARALQLHAIRVPAWLVRGLQSPAWLKTHLPDAVLAVKDETNRLTLCAEGDVSHEFTYSEETGLGFSKTRNDTRYSPEEDDSWY
jgi:CRISPR-associated endonuclease/helicase Cas3